LRRTHSASPSWIGNRRVLPAHTGRGVPRVDHRQLVRNLRRAALRVDRQEHHQHQRGGPPAASQSCESSTCTARGRPLPPSDAAVPAPVVGRLSTRRPVRVIGAFAKPYPSLVIPT
jgi:hypothetical protein